MDDLVKRKKLRLDNYDYSTAGAYFVTICTFNRKPILSEIVKMASVGDGALDVPQTKLTQIGQIAEKYLLSSENISGVKIDKFVIMPEHIHLIIFLDPDKYINQKNGTSKAPSPTNEMLPHVISTFKRFCNKEIGYNIFQRSYIEHIIRDKEDYIRRLKYIHQNPLRRYYADINDNCLSHR